MASMNPLIQRLTESAPLADKSIPLPVIVDSRPVEFHRCPHCQQEIYEKHIYEENGVDYHSDCKGAIKLPPTDWSKYSPEWRALLEPYIKESQNFHGSTLHESCGHTSRCRCNCQEHRTVPGKCFACENGLKARP